MPACPAYLARGHRYIRLVTIEEMNMSMNLPKPIADYVEANARLDIEGMMKPFRHDAVFIDNGKHYEGLAAIRRLLVEEAVAVKAIVLGLFGLSAVAACGDDDTAAPAGVRGNNAGVDAAERALDSGIGEDAATRDAGAIDADTGAGPTGCVIDGTERAANAIDPADECHQCRPELSKTAWSSRGTFKLLSGNVDPATEGWLAASSQPSTSTLGPDYVRLATSTPTGGSTSGYYLLYRPNSVPVGKPFAFKTTLMVEAVYGHNQLDSAAAIMGSLAPPFGQTAERKQMLYLDPTKAGWADDTSSVDFAVVDGAYHTYELAVDAAGKATLSIDGAHTTLTREGYTTNGTIAVGDQTTDPNCDSQLRIRSVERVCP